MTELTAAEKQAALTTFSRAYGSAVAQPMGCFGCAVQLIGIVLLVWVLTHVTEIWNLLDRIAR